MTVKELPSPDLFAGISSETGKPIPKVGEKVGDFCWPYMAAHHDCWGPPWVGTVIPLNDPRAWYDTLKYPAGLYPDGPTVEQVTEWVIENQTHGRLCNTIAVMWNWKHERTGRFGTSFLSPDSVVPYREALAHFKAAYAAAKERDAKWQAQRLASQAV